MTLRLPLRLGTRGSPLALAQARLVKAALLAAEPGLDDAAVEIVVVSTQGDRIQDRTLAEIGGKGLFTEEIEAGLLKGTLDLAVHSMKDMPTALPTGLVIGAVLPRADPRDALIARGPRSVAELPQGCGRRHRLPAPRQPSLRAVRPDLVVVPLRGNVQTRLRKLEAGEVQATFLAMAGLIRLGLEGVVSAVLEPEEMLPAVAQGAIGIECRADDAPVLDLLARINHAPTLTSITAERAFLGALDGSCRTPIAALAELSGPSLRLRGLVASPDGSAVDRIETAGAAADSAALGAAAGRDLRSRLSPGYFALQA